MTDKRDVGFFGVNIFDNPTFAQQLSSNAKAINATLDTKFNTNIEEDKNKETLGFFDRIKSNFSKKCECSCDKQKPIKTADRNSNVVIKDQVDNNNKNSIKLFNSLKYEKGYVLLTVKVNTTLDGGKFGMNMLGIKMNIPKISNIKQQLDVNEKGMFGKLTNIYKNKNEILQAVKKGNVSSITSSIKKTTGINVSKPIDNINKTIIETNSVSKEKTNTENLQNNNTNNKSSSNIYTNVLNNDPVIFALKVSKTQIESRNNIPASILSILDYLITYKGVQFSRIKTLDEISEALLSFFSITEPQSILDIFQQCGKVFGELTDINGIKSICKNHNIITFNSKDKNEWDILKIVYNKLIRLTDNSVIDIELLKSILKQVKDECGEVQSINLSKINKHFTHKLKSVIEDHCNNIDMISTKEMKTIKQSFIDTVCSNDDKYKDLEIFLVIYFNFFLNEFLTGTIETVAVSKMLKEQLYIDITVLNKHFIVDKNIVLYVNPETVKEFLDKFSNDKIVITL